MRSDVIKKGFERAPHRSLLKATGVTDADMGKPFIAVCNSFVEIVPGHVHLNRVGRYVKECIREAGGVAFEFNTIGVDDGIAMGHGGMLYSLPSREIIADSVETMLKAHCFDGMICIPNCDKIIPGMLMAAMRCNVPTIFVSGGPMKAGVTKAGRVVDLISVFEGVAAHKLGNLSDEGLKELEDTGCPTCGCCSGMFTANSMNCLCEALGMALPGSASVLATDKQRDDYYRRGGVPARGPGAQGHQAARHRDARRLRQRARARHGDGRLDEHDPPHAGGGARGGGVVRPGADRRDLAEDAHAVQGVAVVAVPHGGRGPRGGDPGDPLGAVQGAGSHEAGLPHRDGEDPGGERGGGVVEGPGGHPAPVRRVQQGRRARGPLRQPRDRRARSSRPPGSTRRCWSSRGPP